MSDGKMLDELRKLADKEKISSDAAFRLILASNAEIGEDIKGMKEGITESDKIREENVKAIKEQSDCIKSVKEDVSGLRTDLTSFKTTIEENTAIKLGKYIKSNPKKSTFITIILLITANLWFVSGLRLLLFSIVENLLGIPIPEDVILFFNPPQTP